MTEALRKYEASKVVHASAASAPVKSAVKVRKTSVKPAAKAASAPSR